MWTGSPEQWSARMFPSPTIAAGAAYISYYDAVSENLKLAHEVGPRGGELYRQR